MGASPGWKPEAVGLRRPRSSRPPALRGERRRRKQREREHIGRFESAGYTLVQLGELAVIGQDQPKRRGSRSSCSRQSSCHDARERTVGDHAWNPTTNGEINPPWGQVQRAVAFPIGGPPRRVGPRVRRVRACPPVPGPPRARWLPHVPASTRGTAPPSEGARSLPRSGRLAPCPALARRRPKLPALQTRVPA